MLWYYGDNDKVFDAEKQAMNMYNNLETKEKSFNDDYDWDNVDLVQNFLHNLLNNDGLYGGLMDTYHKYGMFF